MTTEPAPRDEESLTYFVEHVRLLLEMRPMDGLRVWATKFTDLRRDGRHEECQRLLDAVKGIELPPYAVGIIRHGEGWLYDRNGRWRDAIAAYRASLAAFATADIPLEAELWTNIGSLYQDQGEWAPAEDAYEQALAAADRRQDKRSRGYALNNLGGLRLLQNDANRATACFEEAMTLLAAAGDRYNHSAAAVGLATVLRDQGRYQDSLDQLLPVLAEFQELSDPHGLASTLGAIALTYQTAGEVDAAVSAYRAALAMFTATNDHHGVARTLGNLAIVAQAAGDLGTAALHVEQALGEYRDLGDRHGETLQLVNLVRLHRLRGDTDAAAAATSEAEDACERYGYPGELARLRAITAEIA